MAEECCCWADVGGPAEPAGVSCVEVHGDVGEVEGFDGVFDTLFVSCFRVGTFRDVEVRDEIGEGVGLCMCC